MIRYIAAMLLVVCAAFPALAQTGSSKSITDLNTETNSNLASGSNITASSLRQVILDMTASSVNLISGGSVTGALTLTGTSVSSGNQAFAETINTSALGGGFNIQQTGAGNSTSLTLPPTFNNILIQENLNDGSGFVTGFNVTHVIQGTGALGGREALAATAQINSTTSASNTNRNYTGLTGICQANANDNGTNPSPSGGCFGLGATFVLANGATFWSNATAAEFNSAAQTGSSVSQKSVIQITGRNDDAVAGTVVDTMIWIYNQGGSPVAHNSAIFIDNNNASGNWPIASTGTIFKTGGSGTVLGGIDLSNTTFSGAGNFAYKSNGFKVDGSGVVSATGGYISNGNTGLTQTCTVNQAKTLIFTLGILTGGSCNT